MFSTLEKYTVILVALILSGCATPGETEGSLREGQWNPVQTIGMGKFIVEGYNTQDAVKGGTVFCEKAGKVFDTLNILPATARDRATITFRCV
jgi:hypothetical protein